MRSRALVVSVLLSLCLFVPGKHAAAATRLHALVIGNNAVFPDSGDGPPSLAPLRYADDDAAAVSLFLTEIGASVRLLTLMDATTQAVYPQLVASARPPTLAAVEEAVAALSAALKRDRARGDDSVVWVFFSGHGSVDYEGEPALSFLDDGMRRSFLYERILARLPARFVHLIVDACHAESVVRPRDSRAEVVTVTPGAANALLLRSTLARFPNVGAILASSQGSQTHEWDAIGHGILTHELLSALRGGADVNGDRRFEYSEVFAFMSAANRSISDPRARLSIAARPPDVDRRAPLLDLSQLAPERFSWLTDVSGRWGAVQVTDERGRRLATIHNAPDMTTALLVPAGKTLFVSAGVQAAPLLGRPGTVTRFDQLRFARAEWRGRGSISNALERGLFATAFGPSYYAGFVDNAPEFIAVPLGTGGEGERASTPGRGGEPQEGASRLRVELGLGLSDATASLLGASHCAKVLLGSSASLRLVGGFDACAARDGPLREWRARGRLGLSWQTAPALVQGFAVLNAGPGIIVQEVTDQAQRSSPLGFFGTSLGLVTRVAADVGVLGALDFDAELARREGETRVAWVPSAWLGATWEP